MATSFLANFLQGCGTFWRESPLRPLEHHRSPRVRLLHRNCNRSLLFPNRSLHLHCEERCFMKLITLLKLQFNSHDITFKHLCHLSSHETQRVDLHLHFVPGPEPRVNFRRDSLIDEVPPLPANQTAVALVIQGQRGPLKWWNGLKMATTCCSFFLVLKNGGLQSRNPTLWVVF